MLSPRQVLDIIPHDPVVSSLACGWRGVTVHAFENQSPSDIRADGFSHHFLILRTEHAVPVRQRRDGRELFALSAPGQLELIPAGMASEWTWGEPVSATHLHLDPKLVSSYVAQSGRDPDRFALRSIFAFHDSLLRQLILALQAEAQTGYGGPLYVDSLAQAVAARIAGHYADSAPRELDGPRRLNARQLRLVCDYIESHLSGELRLDDLADVVGISSFYFARLFKAATGESPHQAVVRQRVERARRLIELGRPLAETAAAVGFSDQSHLARHYKRAFGETPGQTRSNLL